MKKQMCLSIHFLLSQAPWTIQSILSLVPPIIYLIIPETILHH